MSASLSIQIHVAVANVDSKAVLTVDRFLYGNPKHRFQKHRKVVNLQPPEDAELQ